MYVYALIGHMFIHHIHIFIIYVCIYICMHIETINMYIYICVCVVCLLTMTKDISMYILISYNWSISKIFGDCWRYLHGKLPCVAILPTGSCKAKAFSRNIALDKPEESPGAPVAVIL